VRRKKKGRKKVITLQRIEKVKHPVFNDFLPILGPKRSVKRSKRSLDLFMKQIYPKGKNSIVDKVERIMKKYKPYMKSANGTGIREENKKNSTSRIKSVAIKSTVKSTGENSKSNPVKKKESYLEFSNDSLGADINGDTKVDFLLPKFLRRSSVLKRQKIS